MTYEYAQKKNKTTDSRGNIFSIREFPALSLAIYRGILFICL